MNTNTKIAIAACVVIALILVYIGYSLALLTSPHC